MRIRNYRQGDIPTLAHIQHIAAQTDGLAPMSIADFEEWFAQPGFEPKFNVFVITDDDETNVWGQGGTLEGVEGEAVGYTVVQLRRSQHAYHFLCEGAVLPKYRRQNAGRALLICALNRVHMRTIEIGLEATREGFPMYFEALLPVRDPAPGSLTAKCEMQPLDEPVVAGMKLYRHEL